MAKLSALTKDHSHLASFENENPKCVWGTDRLGTVFQNRIDCDYGQVNNNAVIIFGPCYCFFGHTCI